MQKGLEEKYWLQEAIRVLNLNVYILKSYIKIL